ncbi:DUF421 domain-containing protein [Alkalibacillus salilacus]|uniref:Uncharacterized membrane protein YcaP (DUF421 family) n=1 Tax=Alkalibacillus salilacus TaxID=284582 RepID=A0ABT9VBC4_9BACI|nr:uncharacterized membrane protein YcaP (DUF421 family) [Alkalibacillus salilacus]
MMETLQQSLVVIGRVVTILPLLLLMTLFMGKRTIGEMPVFDVLIIISLGSIVGADLADPSISHIYTAVAIVAVAFLQKAITALKLRFRKIGRLITFEPTVVVQNGQLLKRNMKRIGYSIDNVLQLLREKDVFDISTVQTAVIESSGHLSVLKTSADSPVTREDLSITNQPAQIALPVIVEGRIYEQTLAEVGVDQAWLMNQLHLRAVKVDDIFYATLNKQQKLHISLYYDHQRIPNILH